MLNTIKYLKGAYINSIVNSLETNSHVSQIAKTPEELKKDFDSKYKEAKKNPDITEKELESLADIMNKLTEYNENNRTNIEETKIMSNKQRGELIKLIANTIIKNTPNRVFEIEKEYLYGGIDEIQYDKKNGPDGDTIYKDKYAGFADKLGIEAQDVLLSINKNGGDIHKGDKHIAENRQRYRQKVEKIKNNKKETAKKVEGQKELMSNGMTKEVSDYIIDNGMTVEGNNIIRYKGAYFTATKEKNPSMMVTLSDGKGDKEIRKWGSSKSITQWKKSVDKYKK